MKTATASGLLRADLTRALVVDVEDHPGAAGLRARALDLRVRRAVAVAVDLGPLDERLALDELVEVACGRRSGSRVPSVLVRARLARRVRDAEAQGREALLELAREGRLPGAARRREDEEQKGVDHHGEHHTRSCPGRTRPRSPTRRSGPARACARSRPSARRPQWAIAASWLFEPMVLASRAISWRRKSRRRPTASELARRVSKCERVALEAGELLADVDAVREERELLLEAPGVDVDVGGDAEPLGALLELLLVDLDHVRRALGDRAARACAP